MFKNQKVKLTMLVAPLLVIGMGFASSVWASATVFSNPLTSGVTSISPAELVGRIVQALLSVTGILALVMVVYGGTQIALGIQGGKDSKFSAGKKTISYAIIGLIISLGGFLVVDTILGAVFKALGG